jgi:hypothetical protein
MIMKTLLNINKMNHFHKNIKLVSLIMVDTIIQIKISKKQISP